MEIAVVGGGVAGSAAAIALARGGHRVRVIEAHPEPGGTVGSFVSLASNGLRGLDALGCLDQVRAQGFEVARQRMWSSTGKMIGDVARGRRPEESMLSVTLMRGALVTVLRDTAAKAGATFEQRKVSDPSEVDADLIVGADGLWSSLRRHVDPTAKEPEYAGLYTVSGVARGIGGEVAFNMTGGRNGSFIHIPTPDGDVWWSAQVADDEQPDRSRPDWLRRTADLYRDEARPGAVIAATPELSSVTVMHRLEPFQRWYTDRMVLIGDAVHPVGAGQGASMAIEDAIVLSRCLAASPATGLADYAAQRRPRVTEMLKASDDNRKFKRNGLLKRRFQEFFMGLFFEKMYPKYTNWLYDYDPAA